MGAAGVEPAAGFQRTFRLWPYAFHPIIAVPGKCRYPLGRSGIPGAYLSLPRNWAAGRVDGLLGSSARAMSPTRASQAALSWQGVAIDGNHPRPVTSGPLVGVGRARHPLRPGRDIALTLALVWSPWPRPLHKRRMTLSIRFFSSLEAVRGPFPRAFSWSASRLVGFCRVGLSVASYHAPSSRDRTRRARWITSFLRPLGRVYFLR